MTLEISTKTPDNISAIETLDNTSDEEKVENTILDTLKRLYGFNLGFAIKSILNKEYDEDMKQTMDANMVRIRNSVIKLLIQSKKKIAGLQKNDLTLEERQSIIQIELECQRMVEEVLDNKKLLEIANSEEHTKYRKSVKDNATTAGDAL